MWDAAAPFILAFAIWSALVLGWRWGSRHWLRNGPGETIYDFLAWAVVRVWMSLIHHVTYEGREHVPDTNRPGPLIVVSNHTGSVDPLLLQAGCRFNIRWMMATDMMFSSLNWLWEWRRAIRVDRDGKDMAAAREAIRHVNSGGVIGLFPEGRIVNPPRHVWPFADGVGLIVARTNAPVLLVWISGTPPTTAAAGSLFTASHARVQFLELIQFPREARPVEITRALRQKISDASGWPMTPAVPLPRPDAGATAATIG